MAEVQTPPKTRGARSKLTPELVNSICDSVRVGVPKKYAAQAAGIAEGTLYQYLARDSEFSERLKRAEAEAVAANVGVVQRATKDTWQAAAWWLERRYAKDFGRKDQLALSEGEAGEAAKEAIEAIVGAIHAKVPDSCPSCQHLLKIKDDLAISLADMVKQFAAGDPEAEAVAREAQEAQEAPEAPPAAEQPAGEPGGQA